MATLIQRSLSGGEIAPSLHARADTAKFQTALRLLRNFWTMRHGGAASRPGTSFVGEVKDSTKTVRLIQFVFNSDQTYVLEFGNLYMRVIRAGAQVTEVAQNITGITNANPAVLTYAGADNYANGDEVYVSGVVGAIAPYVNGRNFKVAGLVAGSNTFELNYLDGTAVNSTSWGAYTSGGTIAEIYTITTPYLEADLPELQFVQSADVVTIVHPSYAPRELARSGHASWTLSTITFSPTVARPAGCSVSLGGAGANTYRYKVTATDRETAEESLAGTHTTTRTITGITQANPAVVTTSANHGYASGDCVLIDSVVGMTQVNAKEFSIVVLSATTFELQGINSTAYTAYSSAGSVNLLSARASSAAAPTEAAPNVISWTAVTGSVEYQIYKESNGVYGYIGTSGLTSFSDTGITPETSETPPSVRNPFGATGDYPSTVTYYQQRQAFANSNNDPEKIWSSRSAMFKNFSTSSPSQADDAVTWTMAGRQVNAVRHMIDLGVLLVLTASGEWKIEGDAAGILRPGEVNPKQYSYNGSSSLAPLIVGGNALYVQARGSVVRDMRFDDIEGIKESELSIFAAHLFEGYTLRDWAYQQIPHSIVWAARSDGQLLGMTYVREHQVLAWHHHDFEDGDATVEQVCSVPEGTEDALYLVIKHTIGGATKRYIERMKTRRVDSAAIEDYVGMDCSLSYDGWHTGVTTMTMSEYLSGGWLSTSTVTLTASVASTFTAADEGNWIFLGTGDDQIRFTIDTYVSGTVVRGRPHKTVPVSLQAAAVATWARAVDEVTGLWHLEGKTVSVFGDGFVVASPNNDSYTTRTVSSGTLALDRPYAVIHAGLPITADIETLDIDSVQGETVIDKKKIIGEVTLLVESSRGIFAGPKPPEDDENYDEDDPDPLFGLYESKLRTNESYSDPVALTTGTINVRIRPEWNSNGRVFLRQVDPIPLAILSIAPAGLVPFKG